MYHFVLQLQQIFILTGAAAVAARQGTAVLEAPPQPEIRVPLSLREVDNGKILGFGADLAEDHPVGYAVACSDCFNTLPATCLT